MAEVRQWIASVPMSSKRSFWGRMAKLGGTMELTADEVVFTPLLGLGRVRRWRLRDIAGISPDGRRPPRLRMTFSNGKSAAFIVVPRRSSTALTRDGSARDEAIAAVRQRIRSS
jgi:hypothetical protein